MKQKSKSAQRAETLNYTPTEAETAVLKKQAERLASASPLPRIKLDEGSGGHALTPDHPDLVVACGLLAEAFGTASDDFARGLLRQLVNAVPGADQPDLGQINFIVSVVQGIKPRDQTEAMLAAQMAAVHIAIMTFAHRLARVKNIPQQDSAERAFNKLARTFATQMEALKRYRTGGERKVTVQHVSVSEGGQAIVGNVTQSAQETATAAVATPAPALTRSAHAPMPLIHEPEHAAVPVPKLARARPRPGPKK